MLKITAVDTRKPLSGSHTVAYEAPSGIIRLSLSVVPSSP